MSSAPRPAIVVVDYGSQYTLLIARRLRECGVFTTVIGPEDQPGADIEARGIVLSGGPASAHEHAAPQLPAWVRASGLPLMGICYGMQLIVHDGGGTLASGTTREYGRARVHVLAQKQPATSLGRLVLNAGSEECRFEAWMSHGDEVRSLPEGMEVLAKSENGAIAAIGHREQPILGLQFHPEVAHTEGGGAMIERFARLSEAPRDWSPGSMLAAMVDEVRESVGPGRVLLGISGGVDSSVAACVLERALGRERVVAVLVDHGLMRKDEAREVRAQLSAAGVEIKVVNAKERFMKALEGLSEPEAKRKAIGRSFIEVFEEFAQVHGPFTHLGQGTLYPDVIESAGSGVGARVIKSHHNVGGLPERLALKLVEPLRLLFKDEVREVGRMCGLPDTLIGRHPFPGPGLGIRIPGAVSEEKVRILQDADAVFIGALREAGLYDEVWQAATILLPVRSVGVMGDQRTYEWTCVLRAVRASDAMTADVAPLPHDFLSEVAARIVREVAGINRVLYDVTTKPPATIEWE